MWSKARSIGGTRGFTRYAASTCINHLKSCVNHSADIREQAQGDADSPRKLRYSPYGTTWSGATLIPGIIPSGSGSSQMPPPSLPPSTQFSSPAVCLQTLALPSPTLSALPSPQLSALPSPLINTFPLSYGGYYPFHHSDPSPTTSVPHSLYIDSPAPRVLRPTPPPGWGDWPQELQIRFETQIARLSASAGLPLSWVDNPEWIDFVHQFLPAAKSPSRKVLTTRLIPRLAKDYRQTAKNSTRDQNATIQADGWTGANFHHLLAFMIAVRKKVGSATWYSEWWAILANQILDSHGQCSRCIV